MSRPYYFTWSHQPTVEPFPVESAARDEFVLQNGRRIYDFVSTSFQSSFGHSHAQIQSAISTQLNAMPIASPKSSFPLKERVSDRLLDLMDLGTGRVFYTLSGAESVENALKMARQMTRRTKIAARQKSYHGASLGALSVTGDWRNPPHFTIDEHTIRIPEPEDDPDFSKGRKVIKASNPDEVAAVILETISGANGVAIPENDWFKAVQETCSQHGILTIADEVLCGFGRTGPAFAFQHYDFIPDFVCMSKGITGGYIPFGAVWTGPRVVEYYDSEKMVCGLTNYGHPLGLAALEVVIDELTDLEFLGHKKMLEEKFAKVLNDMRKWEEVSAVRQIGLLAAIELRDSAPTWEECFELGLHIYSKGNMLVVAPPFVSSLERLDQALDQLSSAIKKVGAR